jgi:hypothetical protein
LNLANRYDLPVFHGNRNAACAYDGHDMGSGENRKAGFRVEMAEQITGEQRPH